MSRLRQRLTILGFVAGWRLVRVMPRRLATAVFDYGADRATRGAGKGVLRLRRNLRQVVGERLDEAQLDELTRAAMRSYARYWLEAFRLPSRNERQRLDDVDIEGIERLAAAMAAGTGAVLALSHSGNWDAAGAYAAARGWPIVAVAERLKPEAVAERFLAFRESIGMRIVPLTGGPTPVVQTLAERLAEGYVVALVADRDLSGRGVEVRFFGERAKMAPGPALLSLRTGAPLFAVSLWFEGDRTVGRLSEALVPPDPQAPMDERVRALTQRMADEFAIGIAEHPQDWHMLQRIWPDPVEPDTGRSPGDRQGRAG